MAILAMIFGLGGAIIAYSFSGLGAELITSGSISLVSSILGLIGIYLFEKDYRIAMAQYVICGLGIFIGTFLYGVLGFLFYIIAAVVAFVEKDKSGNYVGRVVEDSHFFGDESEIRERYSNFPKNNTNSIIYWTVPVVTIFIIILVAFMGTLSYESDMQAKSEAITIDNLTSDLKVSYGYYTGGVQGNLVSTRDIDSVQVKGVWYSESGAQIDQTYDSNILNDIKANQNYKINVPYYRESSDRPAKVEIQVYESFDKTPLYSKNVTFN